jgi:hypothetical protein
MFDGSGAWSDRLKSGSVGGFLSYDEANAILNYFVFKYPSLVKRETIGRSFEGREIFAYRLFSESDSPAVAIPQALLTSILHGNEPVTLLATIFTMGSLIDEYSLNATETMYLLRTRQLYVIPFVNPDAYAKGSAERNFRYRKNRRPTCELDPHSSGVDLNRNFGFKWSGGTYLNACDTEYSGTGPFSEPETASLDAFIKKHKFISALNLHSFGDMLIYPYNGDAHLELADTHQSFYDEIQSLFKPARAGSAARTLKYLTPGEATDYFYANLSIMAMSLEIGREVDGFLPNFVNAMDTVEKTYRRIKMWLHKIGPDLSQSRLEMLSHHRFGISLRNTGLSESIDDLDIIVHSEKKCGDCGTGTCYHVDDFTRVYSNIKPVGALGWTKILEVPTCGSTVPSSARLCVIEGDIFCRCFPSGNSVDQSDSVCNRLGLQHFIQTQEVSGDGSHIPFAGFEIVLFLLCFAFILVRIIRKSLLISIGSAYLYW